jgi:hypothetical protein
MMIVCNIQSYISTTLSAAITLGGKNSLEVAPLIPAGERRQFTFDNVYINKSFEDIVDESSIEKMLNQLNNGYNVSVISLGIG